MSVFSLLLLPAATCAAFCMAAYWRAVVKWRPVRPVRFALCASATQLVVAVAAGFVAAGLLIVRGDDWYDIMGPFIGVLNGLAAPFVGALVGMLAWFCERRRVQVSAGRCRGCRYDLTGNVTGLCPECGTAAGQDPKERGGFRRARVVLGALAALLACFTGVFWLRSNHHRDAWLPGRSPTGGFERGVQIHSWDGKILFYYGENYDLRGFVDDYGWLLRPRFDITPDAYDRFTVEVATRHWWFFTFFAGGAAVLVLPYWLQRGRREAGHCPTCNYDLTGNISGICPECGTKVSETR